MSQRRTRVTHLFISREYPPASYLPGGIGTYLCHITRLLAGTGDTVHVIAHRWTGAPRAREEAVDGRLIVHRVDLAGEDAVGRALIAESPKLLVHPFNHVGRAGAFPLRTGKR